MILEHNSLPVGSSDISESSSTTEGLKCSTWSRAINLVARGVICLSTELVIAVDGSVCPSPTLSKANGHEGESQMVRLG
jgi:hypothetical protein